MNDWGLCPEVVHWEETDTINFWIEQSKCDVKCPECGCNCISVHETHQRKIQDTPIHNKNVYINIDVRELKCENSKCKVKTFTEELPFAGKHQVRTYALTEFIITHAIYMSSSSTSLILSFIGVNVSADTVDNILKNVHIIDNPDVERIGIDDVAIRKGMKYATAIYDLDTHHLITLLEGREKDDIVPWLKEHKNIKFVARDRASSYAEAIDEVLPTTVQVADRFHLFENIIKYLKEMFYSELSDKIVIKDNEILDKKATKVISELANIDWKIVEDFNYTNDVPIDENGTEIKFIDIEYDLNDEMHLAQTERRMKKYNIAVKIRNEFDLSVDELSEKYDVSQYLVKKYLKMSDEEVEQIKAKRNYNRKETEFSNYKNVVYKMLMDGQPLEYILAYILRNGCDKKIITLKRIISNVAKNNGIAEIEFTGYSKIEYPSDETIIKRRDLLKYLLTINEKIKDQIIESNIEIIKEKYPIV